MSAPRKADVRRMATDAIAGAVLCLAGLCTIEVFAEPELSAKLRLVLTLVFFAMALGLFHFLLGPRRRAVLAILEWKYADAPNHTLNSVRELAYDLDLLVSRTVYCAGTFVAATAIRVLAAWYTDLEPLAGIAWYFWWASLIAMLLFPFVGGFHFQRLYQQYHDLSRRDAIALGFTPRPLARLFAPGEDDPHDEASRTTHADGFDAGGRRWSWQELRTNCIVFGQTGSGKTSCVLNAMMDGLIGAAKTIGLCPGGLVLDPKGIPPNAQGQDFADKLKILLSRCGWDDRLRIIEPARPRQSERWNPLDSQDDELELSARLAAVMEATRDRRDGGDDGFWIAEAQKFVRHAIALLRAVDHGEPPCLADILTLSGNAEELNHRIQQIPDGPLRRSSAQTALEFFVNEWMQKGDEHRSGVQGYVSNMLDPFTMEPYRTIFSGRSTIRLRDAVHDGLIVCLRMPAADKESMARVVATFLKLEFYREILLAVQKQRPSFFVCDEFQVLMTTFARKGDAEFFERSRESNHVNLIATHNLPALTRQTPNNREPAMSLLGNCAVKIFLRNTDPDTNKYASELFGAELVPVSGHGTTAGVGRFGMMAVSSNTTNQYDQAVHSSRFSTLAVPSERHPDSDYCEAIIHDAARPSGPDRRSSRWPRHPIG